MVAHGKPDKLVWKTLSELATRHKFTVDTPIAQLTNEEKCYILYGDGTFEGVVNNLERRYTETNSEYLRSEIENIWQKNMPFM